MRAAHRQWASWFWILFGDNDDRGSHLDAAPEKDQEYQVVRIIGKDSRKYGHDKRVLDISFDLYGEN